MGIFDNLVESINNKLERKRTVKPKVEKLKENEDVKERSKRR